MVSCTDALHSDMYACSWESCHQTPCAAGSLLQVFLKDLWVHMLLTPPAGNWAPHYTANMNLSQSTLGFTPSLPSGIEDPAKDLMRLRTVLIYLSESMGHPTYSCFPQLTCCSLRMSSQGDPAVFGGQWGEHGRWLFHLPAVRGAELSGALPSSPPHSRCHVDLRNTYSLGKGKTHPDIHCLPGKGAFFMQNPWLSVVAGISSPCPCSSPVRSCVGVVTAELRPSLCVELWDRVPGPWGSLGPNQQGKHAKGQHLLQQPALTPRLASRWPGEETQGGRGLTLASPSYPMVNIRSACLLLGFYTPYDVENKK